MRTNIDIDDELMERARIASGKTTKKDAVEEGLRLLVAVHGQTLIRRSRGKAEFWPEVLKDRADNDLQD
jgi:Arc/MetJ family transcription regulator